MPQPKKVEAWEDKFDYQYVSYRDVYDPKNYKAHGKWEASGERIQTWKKRPSPETIKSFIRSTLEAERARIVGVATEMKLSRNMPGMQGGDYDAALDDLIKQISK